MLLLVTVCYRKPVRIMLPEQKQTWNIHRESSEQQQSVGVFWICGERVKCWWIVIKLWEWGMMNWHVKKEVDQKMTDWREKKLIAKTIKDLLWCHRLIWAYMLKWWCVCVYVQVSRYVREFYVQISQQSGRAVISYLQTEMFSVVVWIVCMFE